MRRSDFQCFVKTLAFLAFFFLFQGILHAHVEHSKETPGVGIEEKLGQTVPLDVVFNDEGGKQINLRQVINKPTILAPVYLGCPDVCSFLLYNLARALNQLPSEP